MELFIDRRDQILTYMCIVNEWKGLFLSLLFVIIYGFDGCISAYDFRTTDQEFGVCADDSIWITGDTYSNKIM